MNRTRTIVLSAAAALASAAVPALAQAPAPPPGPAGPYQGQWQGQWGGTGNQTWHGQWTGTYSPGGVPVIWAPPQAMDPEAWQHWHERFERCRNHHPSDATAGGEADKSSEAGNHQDCEAFWREARPVRGGYPMMPYMMPMYGGYPAYGYGYAPYGYVMVPVMIPGKRKPCVETTTTTTTTEYVPVTTKVRKRVIPRRHKYIREEFVPEKSTKE